MGNAGFAEGVDPTIPFLGGPFLSQVYLAVDYDNMVFSLARTDQSATGSKLRKLGCDNIPGAGVVDAPKSSSKAGLIGGVVGGVVGLALIAFLAWFFLFRRRKDTEADHAAAAGMLNAPIGAGMADKKDAQEVAPRYSSPFSPYGSVSNYPPPPPESISTVGMTSPYPGYNNSHYSGTPTWSTSPQMAPQMAPQQLPANTGEGGHLSGTWSMSQPPLSPQQLPATSTEAAELSTGNDAPVPQHAPPAGDVVDLGPSGTSRYR